MSLVKRLRFWIIAALVVIVAGLFALALLQTARADQNGVHGKAALARAETDINAHNVRAARADLLEARADFQQMHHHLASMGPLAPIARITPFVRIQIRGATDFSEAGELLSNAGLHLVDAASQVLDPKDSHLHLSDALDQLRNVRAALNSGIGALDGAASKIRRARRLPAARPAQQRTHRSEEPPAARRARVRSRPVTGSTRSSTCSAVRAPAGSCCCRRTPMRCVRPAGSSAPTA